MILSMRLEQELSKDDILLLYLNHIYLGSGAYGVAAAAREYYGKDIADVNLAEAALLAGLPQAPSRYSPYRHWPEAKARQRYVLNRMYEVGYIDRETRDAALNEPLSLASRKGSFQAAPYFVEHVRRILEGAGQNVCTISACRCTTSTCACRSCDRRCAAGSRNWPTAWWIPRRLSPLAPEEREAYLRAGAGARRDAPTRPSATRLVTPCARRVRAQVGRSPVKWCSRPPMTRVPAGAQRPDPGAGDRDDGRCASSTTRARPSRARWSPWTDAPASSRRWWAATTSSAVTSTASPRPSASRAPPSSRSSSPPRSTATSPRPR
jgi:hypothetical protein